MGCACAKDRETDTEKPKEETPLKTHTKKAALKRSKSLHSRVVTGGGEPSTVTLETIRRLKDSFDSLYKLDGVVSETDSSSLSQAVYTGTEQVCFVKVINKHLGRLQIQQKAKLSSEAERLLKLDHPYLLRLYEVMQDTKHFYLVTEPFAGGHLTAAAGDSRFASENFLAKVFYQIFRALNYCHLRGIIHGNLAPKSLVLATAAEEPIAKLTGFGELDEVPEEGASQCIFRAPELEEGYNEKCDIWSCGAILFYLLSGEAPFIPGPVNGSPVKKKRAVLSFSSPKWENKSREVMSLITCMLDPNPQNRPSASQCRYHPWVRLHLKMHSVKTTTLNGYLFNLRKLHNRNPLQHAILKFIVTRILKEKDVESFVEPFLALDRDGDGLINEEELLQGFMRISSEEEAISTTQKVMETVEHNGCGAITFTEFIISAFGEKKLLSPANLMTAFQCFNRDGSGNVLLQDFRTLLSAKDSSDRERQWRELLLHADRTNDEMIDFGNFTALMSNLSPA